LGAGRSKRAAPILGPSSLPGLVYAVGHYRHGILLTPITAAGIADYLLRGDLPASFRPFHAARFDRSAPRRTGAFA
jgi:glycine oxidase